MEKTCRKLEESLVKVNREYRDSNIKTEETRLAWESAMYRCCRVKKMDIKLPEINFVYGRVKSFEYLWEVDIRTQIAV